MKALKDWSKQIADLEITDDETVLALYSEMLATAHDIGYKVPDDQLIESEDPAKLKAAIPALHAGIIKAHAEAKKRPATEFAPTTESAHSIKASELKGGKAKAKPKKEKAPKKPAKSAVQKEPDEVESKTMATATAKKAAKKAPAKKAAKAAPAKADKKAAKANARTAAGATRNPFGDNAVIKVLNKETGVSADSERGKRIAVVFKYNGKKVSDFFSKEKSPMNRTDTLRFLIDRKFISVK
jgi:membrane protein involved in colicin uptake